MGKPRNIRKNPTYPEIPKIPERKKDTRKYPIVFLDTPTRPDPLPGILSNTRPDPTRCWKTLPAGHWVYLDISLNICGRSDTHTMIFYFRLQILTQFSLNKLCGVQRLFSTPAWRYLCRSYRGIWMKSNIGFANNLHNCALVFPFYTCVFCRWVLL